MAVKEQFFRYRIITNLLCNMQPNCYFCYQPNKDPKLVLDMDKMKDTFRRCGRKMKRATIMGGESTILPNLHEYIALTKANVEEDVCLVTNGILLDEKRIILVSRDNSKSKNVYRKRIQRFWKNPIKNRI